MTPARLGFLVAMDNYAQEESDKPRPRRKAAPSKDPKADLLGLKGL